MIILCVVTVLCACGGNLGKRRAMELNDAVSAYAQAVRWARYEDALDYHLSKDRQRLKLDLSTLDSIRITRFTVNERVLGEDFLSATISGEISYINTDYGTVRKMPVTQSWWYDEESDRWLLDGPFPQFK